MNFSPQKLAQESQFSGDAVTHIFGPDRNAFKGFDGIKLGARARQTPRVPRNKPGMRLTNG